MIDCWRELDSRSQVSVKIFLEISRGEDKTADNMCRGLDCTFCYRGEPVDKKSVRQLIGAFNPDMLVVVGWRAEISRFVTTDSSFKEVPKILAFDMIFQFRMRKLLAPFVLHSYLEHFTAAFVPGDRTAFYSRFLGFKSSQIYHGLFSIDTQKFSRAADKRFRLGTYPCSFVFVGRYAKEKRLDVLVAAYKMYRSKVDNPWTLNCYGQGDDFCHLQGVDGVYDCGHVMSANVPDVYADNGALILASEYDPWPLVVAEACASGLPVICTEACGSHSDLVRSLFNGVVCGTNDPVSLAKGMLWIHENQQRAADIGRRGMDLVKPYSKEHWADRISYITAICCDGMSDRKVEFCK